VSPARRRGEDLAARAAVVAGHPQQDAQARAATRPPRTRPVRVTVELSPVEHRALRTWCAETSADLDLPLVAGAEVLRVLLHLMQTDAALADAVRADLERSGGSRRRQ
jgi:hypothetical protein